MTPAQHSKWLRRVGRRVFLELRTGHNEGLDITHGELQATAPVRTGRYRREIVHVPSKTMGGKIRGSLEFRAPYSPYVFGQNKHQRPILKRKRVTGNIADKCNARLRRAWS